ncbi:MAG: SUMF1/EgtB/PvdO family nonheme iron enzyme, partial [Bacteroidota bacterium]
AKGNQREGGVSWYRIHDYSMIEEVKGEFVVKKGYENHPVVGVSWFGAIAYCDWLSEKTGETYRLPSESEWEYAAGGGASNRTRFSGTDQVEQLDYFGNKKEKSRLDTFAQVAPVASFQKNAVGLHDMSGNVWEWCFDVWHTDYRGIPKSGDPWIEGVSADRVMRGGSWSTEILQLWISFRDSNEAHQRYDDLGFRVAKDK